MNKPKLLLHGGWNWAASSPLCYTLQRNAKYCHYGYTKRIPHLNESLKEVEVIYDRLIKNTWENFKKGHPGSHKMNHTEDMDPIKDFDLSHLKQFITPPITVSNYINFYRSLHDHIISKGFKSVGIYQPHFYFDDDLYHALNLEFDIKYL